MGMVIQEVCPCCKSPTYKKNGHIHNGKQNHQCKDCGRQFVDCFEFGEARQPYRCDSILHLSLQPHACQGLESALHGHHYHCERIGA